MSAEVRVSPDRTRVARRCTDTSSEWGGVLFAWLVVEPDGTVSRRPDVYVADWTRLRPEVTLTADDEAYAWRMVTEYAEAWERLSEAINVAHAHLTGAD
ncbi:MAG: hypothetical protein ACRCZP_14510, partial [Phycicoccus sp.]